MYDMVRALLALTDSGDGVVGPVNLGNPDELPVIEVARRVLAQTRSHAGIEFHPLPVDDPRRRRPAIDLALSLLGWRPLVDLDTGLARTVADFTGRGSRRPYPPRPSCYGRPGTRPSSSRCSRIRPGECP